MTAANAILRAILIEQFRIGDVLNRVRDDFDAGCQSDEKDAGLVRDYCGRLDGLSYALAHTAPNWRALCAVAGIPESEIEESLARIGMDLAVEPGLAGKLALYRLDQAESQ